MRLNPHEKAELARQILEQIAKPNMTLTLQRWQTTLKTTPVYVSGVIKHAPLCPAYRCDCKRGPGKYVNGLHLFINKTHLKSYLPPSFS